MPTMLYVQDALGGSLTTLEMARAVESGVRRRLPEARVMAVPRADGSLGTLAAALAAGFTPIPVRAVGPTGVPRRALYARKNATAVIDVEEICGLGRVVGGPVSPLCTTSRGVGQVIRAALHAGCKEIVLGVGGISSVDGGAGLARELGARLLDPFGGELAEGAAALTGLHRLEMPVLESVGARVTLVCNVDVALTGASGTAAVYAPQLGVKAEELQLLDRALDHWADLVAAATGTDLRSQAGAGSGGGVGFAARSFLQAGVQPSFDLLLDLFGVHEDLVGVDLVVTDWGASDESTANGDSGVDLITAARAAGIPILAISESHQPSSAALADVNPIATYTFTDVEPDERLWSRERARLLGRLGERIAADHLLS